MRAISSSISFMLLVLMSFAPGASAAAGQSLCSSQNTGSDFDAVDSNYQSNGACGKTCGGYAFAIVQYSKCWCSNIAPADTVDVSQCNEGCPGYPYDLCGNENSGLFGYITLGKAPQGTADGSSPSTPAPPSSTPNPPSSMSDEPDTVTSLATVTSIAVSVQVSVSSVTHVQVSSVLISPSSSAPPSSTPTPTPTPQSSTSTWSPTPSPSVMTVSGSVQTVVITPTAPPQATTTVTLPGAQPDNEAASTNGGFFSNKGAVAGVFTVVGLACFAAIAFALWFFLLRRRRDAEGSERLNSFEEERGSRPPTFMSRRTSTLGLRTDVGGIARGADSEKTPTGSQMAQTPGTMSRRTSIPLTDQRLNATALFHDNGSHMSVASLQDNQDYSRPVLQIANPDRPGSSAIVDD